MLASFKMRLKHVVLLYGFYPTCNFGAGKFCDDMACVLPSISQPNLYQIQLLGGVLESSGPAESKTFIEIQFSARFHGEKQEKVCDK